MARSVKKGPYVYHKLLRKIDIAQSSKKKSVIKNLVAGINGNSRYGRFDYCST